VSSSNHMSNYHSAMAAIARVSDNYFTGQDVNLVDLQPVFLWLQGILHEVYADIQSNYAESLEQIMRTTSSVDMHLSDTGVTIVDRLRKLIAMLVAAFTYVKNKLC